MIKSKSIWKYKGEESGYMEKTMEKIRTMMNGAHQKSNTGSEAADTQTL